MGVCEFCHAETEIERHKESCPWQGTATEIIGVKFVEQASAFVRYNGLTYVIKGYPACPMCKEILTKVPTNRNVEEVSIWHCEGCGTTWESHDLVEAIVTEDMLLDEGKR